MSYIDRNLLQDERIVFRTKKHLVIFLLPVFVLIFCSYASYYMSNNDVLDGVTWVPWVVVVLIWGCVALNYYFSEFAVTNKRVMMREGFITRHTNELRLSAISQVNVDQNILGQMLNFGTVSINAFGAADAYSLIDHPGKFQKAVNEQLDRVVSGK